MNLTRFVLNPGFWIFSFCLSSYLLTMGGHLYSADNEIKGLIAESIIERHSVALPELRMVYMVPGRDGLSYSNFPLGSSLTMIPFYMIGDLTADWFPQIPRSIVLEFFFSTINSIMTAASCTVFFLICLQLKYSIRTATATALIYGFSTIAWPYAKTTWSEPQATLCVLAAFYFILRFREHNGLKWLVLSGACLGYGITTKHEMGLYTFLLSGLLLLYLWQADRKYHRMFMAGLACGIPLALFGLLNLYYNFLRFEDWFAFGHYQTVQQQMEQTAPFFDSMEGFIVGIYQHLFSTGKGILIYSPPMLMFYWAIKKFKGSHPVEAWFCLAAPVVFFIAAGTSWQMTFMAWGERYFVSLTPFLILPLAALLEDLIEQGSTYMKRSMITLVAIGVCIQILGVSVNFQATSDKLLAKGDRFNLQTLSYDPEYSPVLLNFKEFVSHFSGTWQLLNAFSHMESLESSGAISIADLDDKSVREKIRFNTFDFWFFYMFFSRVPPVLMVIPLLMMFACAIMSGCVILSIDGRK